MAAFSRFFDAVGYSHGDLTNYANVARDCGVDAKTVKEYYQILVDTLLGTFIEPWKRRQERQVIGKAAKFYLFDVGVAGAITRRHIAEERGEQFGRALEHFTRPPRARPHRGAALAGVLVAPVGRRDHGLKRKARPRWISTPPPAPRPGATSTGPCELRRRS